MSVFVATRIIDTAFFILASKSQRSLGFGDLPGYFINAAHPASPGYWTATTNWDGQWYEFIATHGYQVPAVASVDAAQQAWAWAFPPAYPMLVRLMMTLSGLSFPVASGVCNLALGAIATLLLFRMLEGAAGVFIAASGVLLWSSFVSAPLLQAAYSESLASCLLLGCLLALQGRRYATAAILVVALSFTRIITPPLALVAVAHAIDRHRKGDRLNSVEYAKLAAVALLSLTGAFHWSWVAVPIVGSEVAFVRNGIAEHHGLGWFSGTYSLIGWPGPAFIVVCLVFIALFCVSKRSAAWGLESRVWHGAYVVYLAAATGVHGGILRYLLLAPMIGVMIGGGFSAPATNLLKVRIAILCLAGLALQWWWVSQSFILSGATNIMP